MFDLLRPGSVVRDLRIETEDCYLRRPGPKRIGRRTALRMVASVAGTAMLNGGLARRALSEDAIPDLDARLIAVNIPGASAIAQIGTFLLNGRCAHPIPSNFPKYIESGAVLDPKRLLVGSSSNFGAPIAVGVGRAGAFLSIDPTGSTVLSVPPTFASNGGQASTLGGYVQMFSANSPSWINGINNHGANTAQYAGVGNPLGLSNNNAFGRIWPANAPFGEEGAGSSSILDPTGLPLLGAPNPLIGGVYVGNLTNRNRVAMPPQPQVIKGSLRTGAIGTALLGPSPDGSCKAVFCVVTADGAIVQEHTVKGLDGLAPAGTVRPLLGRGWDFPDWDIEPRLGVLMNPYTKASITRQLFVSEPFDDAIAVLELVTFGTAPNQVFALAGGRIKRIRSEALNVPVDLTPAAIDTDNVDWASNTTLDDGSDLYVANRGDNTIVRIRQDGTVVALRRVKLGGRRLDARLNGIASSTDGSKIYATFTGPRQNQGGVLEVAAFDG
jgi:hypothetical protein